MESASRRATAAEAELEEFKKQRSVELELFQSQSDELEQLRKRLDASLNGSAFDRPPLDASEGADSAGADMLDPDSFFSGFMARMSEDTQRLMESATAAASRINAEAESELAKAREYAEEITREARKEAEDLLRTAVDAIDRDTTLTDAAREKAESDASTALRAREDAERALAKARSDADQLLAAARSEAERLINEGQTRHDQLIQAAQTEVEGKLGAARDDLADEIAGFRSFLDGVRSRVEEMGRSAGENGSSSAIDLRDGRIVAPPPKIVSH
jgi:hypothetical protein